MKSLKQEYYFAVWTPIGTRSCQVLGFYIKIEMFTLATDTLLCKCDEHDILTACPCPRVLQQLWIGRRSNAPAAEFLLQSFPLTLCHGSDFYLNNLPHEKQLIYRTKLPPEVYGIT
jgi:hypothetical protein